MKYWCGISYNIKDYKYNTLYNEVPSCLESVSVDNWNHILDKINEQIKNVEITNRLVELDINIGFPFYYIKMKCNDEVMVIEGNDINM